MLATHWAVIQNGQIQLLDKARYPDGTRVIVTVLNEEEQRFWLNASESALRKIWDNPEDDIYEQLLTK